LQSIIDKCRICGTEGETIEHIISSCTVLAQSEYKKRHDIFAKIIHMNLAVKFNLLKNTQPHCSYTPESCLENDNYKLYFDRAVLTVVVMSQGLDTGLSTKPPGFDSRLNIRFFQITTIFRRRCKAVGPGYYLVVVVRLC
jgi:hypothetical protein